MKNFKKLLALLLSAVVLAAAFAGCKKDGGSETDNNTPSESDSENGGESGGDTQNGSDSANTEKKDIDAVSLLDMKYSDVKANSSLKLSSHTSDGAPVLELTDSYGLYVKYAPAEDGSTRDTPDADELPAAVIIRDDKTKLAPGVYVGMDGESAKKLIDKWDTIYMSDESAMYYTEYTPEGSAYKIIAGWSIPDVIMSEWEESLTGLTTEEYKAKLEMFIPPFRIEPVGEIEELMLEKVG